MSCRVTPREVSPQQGKIPQLQQSAAEGTHLRHLGCLRMPGRLRTRDREGVRLSSVASTLRQVQPAVVEPRRLDLQVETTAAILGVRDKTLGSRDGGGRREEGVRHQDRRDHLKARFVGCLSWVVNIFLSYW